MAFSRVLPLLVLSVISCYASNVRVPVYMWGDLPLARKDLGEESSPYALSTVSVDKFQDIVKKELVSDRMLVVFIENAVSVEDFSQKNEDGETAFPYLHNELKKSIYFPNVKNPVHSLHRIASHDDAVHLKLTEDGLTGEIDPEDNVVFVKLEDALNGESRIDMLTRHDNFMKDTIDKLQESRKVVAIYTGHQPSWTVPVTLSRSRRAVQTSARVYALDGLRFYTKSISLISNNNTVHLNGMTASKTDFNNTVMNTTLTFDNQSITLNFREDIGYWYWDSVVLTQSDLTETLYPPEELFAIMGFSYRCQQYVTFSSINDTKPYTLQFEDLKIQPYFEPTNSSTTFGDSFNCVGFFSAPIWSALFVVFILLTIMFYGIMMMLDIKTMDRFDDPKGKTITINAAE